MPGPARGRTRHAQRACSELDPAASASRRASRPSAAGSVQFSPNPAPRPHVRPRRPKKPSTAASASGVQGAPARDSRSRCPSGSQTFGRTCARASTMRPAQGGWTQRPAPAEGRARLAEVEKEGLVCSRGQVRPCGARARTAPAEVARALHTTALQSFQTGRAAACPKQVMRHVRCRACKQDAPQLG